MHWFRLIILAAVAGQLAVNGADADRAADGGAPVAVAKLPPVLRPTDPPDSRQITLPGPVRAVPAVKRITPVAPVANALPSTTLILEDYALRQPMAVPVVLASLTKVRARSRGAGGGSGGPCQSGGGCPRVRVTLPEADRKVEGSRRPRPARGTGAPSVRPTMKRRRLTVRSWHSRTLSNKYKELELDFDAKSGHLRTVFVYPPRLTLAGLPAPVERTDHRRRCRAGPQILLLYEPAPGRPGGRRRQSDQPRLVLSDN